MIRDLPPWIRVLKASFQPLIGGAMKCYRRAVVLLREAQAAITRDVLVKHGGSYTTPPVCSAPSHH
jgi:hypothetical protein